MLRRIVRGLEMRAKEAHLSKWRTMEEEEIMLLSKGVKLLVADDERAMLLENDGTPDKPALRLLGARKAEPAIEFSDRPGVANDRGTGHSTTYDQGAPEEIARQRFAQALVGFAGAHINGSRLVIAAPPRMLAAPTLCRPVSWPRSTRPLRGIRCLNWSRFFRPRSTPSDAQ